mmetsp:Transcript_52050/g.123274  ORF Transcript_52050/g.123274 Transcript_52050/m.123274 type:complete len:242 (+) Transcript_52050:588-1313(+)
MISPSTRWAMTVESSSITSTFRNLARLRDARESRKSPARIASLLPSTALSDLTPRRISPWSMTSSCSSDAVWIISVISARRCWPCVISPTEGLACATSRTSAGRKRLPGTSKKYRATLLMTSLSDSTIPFRFSVSCFSCGSMSLKGSTTPAPVVARDMSPVTCAPYPIPAGFVRVSAAESAAGALSVCSHFLWCADPCRSNRPIPRHSMPHLDACPVAASARSVSSPARVPPGTDPPALPT